MPQTRATNDPPRARSGPNGMVGLPNKSLPTGPPTFNAGTISNSLHRFQAEIQANSRNFREIRGNPARKPPRAPPRRPACRPVRPAPTPRTRAGNHIYRTETGRRRGRRIGQLPRRVPVSPPALPPWKAPPAPDRVDDPPVIRPAGPPRARPLTAGRATHFPAILPAFPHFCAIPALSRLLPGRGRRRMDPGGGTPAPVSDATGHPSTVHGPSPSSPPPGTEGPGQAPCPGNPVPPHPPAR